MLLNVCIDNSLFCSGSCNASSDCGRIEYKMQIHMNMVGLNIL